MMMYDFVSLLVLSMIGLSIQVSTPTSSTYEGGVVEFTYERDPSITQASRTASNLAQYLEIMRNAPETLDIIVFPEMTLNQMQTAVEIPEPTDQVSPCDSADFPEGNLVKEISCSAKTFKRYTVVGMVTKVACPDEDMVANEDPRDCADRVDRMSYYNTNVVFDRNGTVVSRYRKYNLFGEDVDRPFKAAIASFETDFGVRFGHFICFDILFRYPALEVLRSQNITDIIYPTMWYSELPFLTAVQVQQNWAFSNNVNLLASGANNPTVGSTGTGIFAGRKGSLISVMEGINNTKLYTAIVPKIGLGDNIQINQTSIQRPREEVAGLVLNSENLEKYNIQFLNVHFSVGNTDSTTLCHNEYCCTFDYGIYKTTSQELSYSYAAVVFHGSRIMDGSGYGITVCAVIACNENNTATCGVRNETLNFDNQWHKLEITGQFPKGDQFFYFPTTVDTSIMPFKVDEFEYNETSNGLTNVDITMKSVGIIRDFYSFGIYGRDFNLDGSSSAGVLQTIYILIMLTSFVTSIRNVL